MHQPAEGTVPAQLQQGQQGQVMGLLHEHVPLSLLVDLAAPGPVDSRAILEDEGAPDGAWWEPEAL